MYQQQEYVTVTSVRAGGRKVSQIDVTC